MTEHKFAPFHLYLKRTIFVYWIQYRDHEDYNLIAKLAAFEHIVPPAGLFNELIAIIKKINKYQIQKKIDSIVNSSKSKTLTTKEKIMLKELLSKQKSVKQIN